MENLKRAARRKSSRGEEARNGGNGEGEVSPKIVKPTRQQSRSLSRGGLIYFIYWPGIHPAEVRAFIHRVPVFMCRRLA